MAKAPANKASTEIVKPAAAALVEVQDSFSDFAGQGLEDLSKDDLAIPFLTILQSGSPQVKRSDGQYVEGAAEGMLFNTVTKEVIDPIKDPVIVVAAAYERHYVEWRIRENGGGFIKQHPADPAIQAPCIRDEKSRDILPNGNQLNDTRTFYVMVIKDGMPSPAVITMTSTQIRKAKQWLMQQSLLKLKRADGTSYTPPMFAAKWRLTTVPESNDRGSWMGWKFENEGYLAGPKDPVFVTAMDFHKSIAAGTVQVDLSKQAGEADTVSSVDDTDIPF